MNCSALYQTSVTVRDRRILQSKVQPTMVTSTPVNKWVTGQSPARKRAEEEQARTCSESSSTAQTTSGRAKKTVAAPQKSDRSVVRTERRDRAENENDEQATGLAAAARCPHIADAVEEA